MSEIKKYIFIRILYIWELKNNTRKVNSNGIYHRNNPLIIAGSLRPTRFPMDLLHGSSGEF